MAPENVSVLFGPSPSDGWLDHAGVDSWDYKAQKTVSWPCIRLAHQLDSPSGKDFWQHSMHNGGSCCWNDIITFYTSPPSNFLSSFSFSHRVLKHEGFQLLTTSRSSSYESFLFGFVEVHLSIYYVDEYHIVKLLKWSFTSGPNSLGTVRPLWM
jgi:hypothetical protein